MLDVCARCHGVWFDHSELKAVWEMNLAAAAQGARRSGRGTHALAVGGDVLLETLFWAPGLVVNGTLAATHAAGTAIQSLGHVASSGAIGGAAEVAGQAAEGVFETILEIIGGIFDGF